MAAPRVQVTLVALEPGDLFPKRRFTVTSSTPIGRSSRNNAKKELMSAHNNAFFDSPVISREHAKLSTDTSLGIPIVYLTDKGSMHGTRVNGTLLAPNKPHKLNDGDELQFGLDVIRNDSQFKARKYRFQVNLMPPQESEAFPQGFSVPEVESSDEGETDDGDMEQSSSPTTSHRWGSQSNPVNIDDIQDVPPAVIILDDESIPNAKRASSSDTPEGRLQSPAHKHRTVNEPSNEPKPMAYSLVEDSSDEETGHMDLHDDEDEDVNESIHPSEAEDDSQDEISSEAGEDSVSDLGSVSASESDSDDEPEDADAVRRLKMEAMLNHEHQKETNKDQPSIPAPSFTSQAVPIIPNPPTAPTIKLQEPSSFYHASSALDLSNVPTPEMDSTSMFPDNFGQNFWDMPPLPPRPSAPKPPAWSSYLNREVNHDVWYPESPAGLFVSGPDYRADIFSRPPAPVNTVNTGPFQQAKPFLPQISQTIPDEPSSSLRPDDFNLDDRVSSAPALTSVPTPPMPASDDVGVTPQPHRRTKVSIPEIVEDAPQQPPTPTSVSSLKRKADVLDSEDEEPVEEDLDITKVESSTSAPIPAAEAQQPPRKKLRAVGSFAKTAVASIVAGGLLAFGALATLPDQFFEN